MVVKVHFKGTVQRVGFRYFVQQHARALRVSGWVKNNPDATVSARFEGTRENVAELLKFCTMGPRLSRVSGIYFEELEEEISSDNFKVL